MRVIYTGFLRDLNGFGEAARRTIQALQLVGADVRPGLVLTDGGPVLEGMDARFWEPFIRQSRHPQADIHVIHAIGSQFPEIVRSGKFAPRTVGLTCWETDRLPGAFIQGCHAVDHMVVPTTQNLAVFHDAGIRADLVPYPISDLPDPEPILPLMSLKSTHVFYTVGTWQRRKNLDGILTAILTACVGNPDVAVIVKIGGGPLAVRRAQEEVQALVGMLNLPDKGPEVILLGTLTAGQMTWLHQRATCYISLARGEGFALPMADACLAGKAIIATDWGGHLDFLTASGSPRIGVDLVRWRKTPVVQAYPLFSGVQYWAEPDLFQAQGCVTQIAMDPEASERKYGRNLSAFSPKEVGRQLLEVLACQISAT